MKLVRYGDIGAEKPGILDGNGAIRDLSGVVDDIAGAALTAQEITRLQGIDPTDLPHVPDVVRLGPCVGGTGKFICIGLNYADHAAESGMDIPPEPVMFMKATSSICGPNDPIVIPRDSTFTRWAWQLIRPGNTA